MLKTDKQRAWWFATHPEYSDGRGGDKPRKPKEAEHGQPKVPPEEVDAAVDRALLTATGAEAALLESIKRNFGTEGYSQAAEQRLAFADEIPPPSDTREGDESKAGFWDAFLYQFHHGLQDVDGWLGLGGALARPGSKLGRNLIKTGRRRPAGHAAHHNVPRAAQHPAAKRARDILRRFKIDIDDPANGVWLRNNPLFKEGVYHPSLHTHKYYRRLQNPGPYVTACHRVGNKPLYVR
jgi:hypothetical protein